MILRVRLGVWQIHYHKLAVIGSGRKRWYAQVSQSRAVEIVAEETISTHKSYSIIKNTTSRGLSRAYSTSWHSRFGTLSHQTRVEFKILDMAIEEFSSSSSILVCIPFFEIFVWFEVEITTESENTISKDL